MIGVSVRTDTTDIEAVMRSLRQSAEESIVRKLSKIGAECIEIARNTGSVYNNMDKVELEVLRHRPHQPNYIDDTRNLRNSLGYAVVVDGVARVEDFTSDIGYSFAHGLIDGKEGGIYLLMVAGADYAKKLTFEKGYDVLDSASIEARRQFIEYVGNQKQ